MKTILQVQQFKNGRWIRKADKKTFQALRKSRDFYKRRYPMIQFRIVELTISPTGEVTTKEVQ